jgi:hypothetical protein
LIGSPGNGKSAKLGLLARRLLAQGYEIVSDDGASIGEPGSAWLPYLLEVREAGKPYCFAYFLQDASVVRYPFGQVCDPALDLVEVLREAARRGISLLFCTNWGVIQRVFDRIHVDPELRDEEWFRAVRKAVDHGYIEDVTIFPSDKKAVFGELSVTYEYLDNRSLLVAGNVFENLVSMATDEQRWQACTGCPSLALCPFKANRDDLASDDGRAHVLDILRRAEVLSGQVIVFREATAMVSLFLAGCPNDYYSGQAPCDWVHNQVKAERVFNLLARRLPALLFGSARPHGLEGSRSLASDVAESHRDQVFNLREISSLLDEASPVRGALLPVLEPGNLSSDVGVSRLLGWDGVLGKLDPSLDPRNVRLLDDFVAEVTRSSAGTAADIGSSRPRGISEIEFRCLGHWSEMFDVVESESSTVQAPDMYFWLRRWQSKCLAWIAGVSRGCTALQPELERYLEFQSTEWADAEKLKTVRTLEDVLEGLLAGRQHRDEGGIQVELSASMRLSGYWAERQLRPKLELNTGSDSNALHVRLGEKHVVVISAETFSWLSRKHQLHLSELSFNPDILETLHRAQAQAAAASDYSVQDEDVEIIVIDEDGREYGFERIRGHLIGPEEA